MLSIRFLRNIAQTIITPHRSYSLRILALFLAGALGLSLIQPALAAPVWQVWTLDSDGQVGFDTSIGLDSSGNPVISYINGSDDTLRLVDCGNALCSSGNNIAIIDQSSTQLGYGTSLELDSLDRPVISYLDGINNDLKLVRCGNTTCSSGNIIRTVDSAGGVGSFSSLQLDSLGRPVISYYDFGNTALKFVRCGDSTCSTDNVILTLDSAGFVGSAPSLALDSTDKSAISYYDGDNRDLKLVRCGNPTCVFGNTIQILDSDGDVGVASAIALDRSGLPVIGYLDVTNGDLKVARCIEPTCTFGKSIQTVDSASNVIYDVALRLDSSDNAIIGYRDSISDALNVVHCGNALCTSGNTTQTAALVPGAAAFVAMALDSSGLPALSYFDVIGSDLKFARLVDDPPPSVTINQAAGQADPTNSNPVLFSASFSKDVTGFTNADVTLSGTANLAGANIMVSGGPRDYTIGVSGLTGNGTVIASLAAGVATDGAGNPNTASTSTDNSVTFNLDSTPPVITVSLSPVMPIGHNGWYVSAVTVSFTCADEASGSGLATNTVTGVTLGTDGANQSVTNPGTCSDKVGNAAAPVTVRGLNLDKTPPTLASVVSPNPVVLGATATVTSGATDGISGLASQRCGTLDTSSVGVKQVTCTATDNAGNSSSATVAYTVQAPGVLIGSCGGYTVYQANSSYIAIGWSGSIKVGTNSNNTINGTNGADLILGLGGNDLIDGKDGDDVICGGDGVDLLTGGVGNDYLDGGNGNDVLNGGSGDFDQLIGGEGNDTLLDGDGVSNAQGGSGNDGFTLALRNGWRDPNGEAKFAGRLAAGYGNDTVVLIILDRSPFFVDITGDERDNPASTLEGNKDGLGLLGNLSPAPIKVKFEAQLVVSAEAAAQISETAGAEYLTEPVGEDSETAAQNNRIFLPVINR